MLIKFVVVGGGYACKEKDFFVANRTQKAGIFLRGASPLYLSPLTVCNSKVEIFVQRHSIYF
ncbi:hypothetical protein, partial [[Ruminococcus] lactaris]|uniref:hypothetical protein n=1 Tax=[Ruminococcus] lactaris TaxID=46228 RepID=UPI00356ADC05